MKRCWAFFTALVIALFFTSSLATTEVTEETDSDHHEHPGLTDASPTSQNHAHGDSDDHHSGPSGSCHHHVIHCGCSHVQTIAAFPLPGMAVPVISHQVSSLPLLSQISLVPKSIFHIPIA